MVESTAIAAETAAPDDRRWVSLDARDLPPPEPLQRTLECLADLGDDAGLVQLNDRAPQHLYPKLTDRGYEFETVDRAGAVATVIWRP